MSHSTPLTADVDIGKDHLDARLHPGRAKRRFAKDDTGYRALIEALRRQLSSLARSLLATNRSDLHPSLGERGIHELASRGYGEHVAEPLADAGRHYYRRVASARASTTREFKTVGYE